MSSPESIEGVKESAVVYADETPTTNTRTLLNRSPAAIVLDCDPTKFNQTSMDLMWTFDSIAMYGPVNITGLAQAKGKFGRIPSVPRIGARIL